MIRRIQGLAALRPPLMPTPTKPGPSIAAALARAGEVRHSDLSTCWRVVGQSRAITSEIWFSDPYVARKRG